MAQTLVGLFHGRDEAHAAIQDLTGAGFGPEDVGLIAPEDRGGDVAAGAGAGALVGGATGLLLTVVAFAIPGVGPIVAAGTLAGLGTLTGASVGIAAGGLIGALVRHGVPADLAPHYEEGLRHGGAVVTVRTSGDDERRILEIFRRHGAAEVEATGISAAALRRGHEELQHIAPAGSEPLRFGDEGVRTQVGEDPISEIAVGRETRP